MKSYEISTDKQDCRDKLVEITNQYIKVPKKVISLPSKTAMCIKTFRKHWPDTGYIGIEREEEDWKEICEQGIDCYHSDIRQYIHAQTIPVQHCDLFFMDYYSYLSTEILGDIKALLNNRNLVHEGKTLILGLTLAKAMRGNKENTLDFMRDYIDDGHRIEITNSLENVEMALVNYLGCEFPEINSISLEYSVEYLTGVPMYFLVFKIVK